VQAARRIYLRSERAYEAGTVHIGEFLTVRWHPCGARSPTCESPRCALQERPGGLRHAHQWVDGGPDERCGPSRFFVASPGRGGSPAGPLENANLSTFYRPLAVRRGRRGSWRFSERSGCASRSRRTNRTAAARGSGRHSISRAPSSHRAWACPERRLALPIGRSAIRLTV
jgi:hypothetical protein